MRSITVLFFLVLLAFSSAVRAEEALQGKVVLTPELVEAQYALRLARMQVRDYQFVTLPAARQALDNQVDLAQTEVAILAGRLRDYEPFLRVGEYSPVRTAAESHYLAYMEAQQRLRQLEDARINLMRTTRQQFTLYNLQVLHAATRVAQVRQELAAERQ